MKLLGALAALIFIAACQHELDQPDTGLVGFDPHLIENQTQACLDSGGRFGAGGSGGSACFYNTKDANQRCEASTDCEGLCLARSGTCAPVTPLFGCHEVLGRLGAPSTLCLN
jgi:hypothetical protein